MTSLRLGGDLKREQMAQYMKEHSSLGAKTRNERRGVVKMFLQWAVEQDYLSPAHRLFEASELGMEPDDGDGEIQPMKGEQRGD